jgi:hypothetical protein
MAPLAVVRVPALSASRTATVTPGWLMVTSSALVGTWAGLQLLATSQKPLLAEAHDTPVKTIRSSKGSTSGRTRRGAPGRRSGCPGRPYHWINCRHHL